MQARKKQGGALLTREVWLEFLGVPPDRAPAALVAAGLLGDVVRGLLLVLLQIVRLVAH